MLPSLFVFRGNDQGLRFELSGEAVGVGRDGANAVQIHDTEVSRRHAELRLDEAGAWILTDLGSSNGTFVNGRRVDRHTLATGDEIQVGRTQLQFTAASADARDEIAEKIDIVAPQQPETQSRIVRSMSQEEGSRIFDSTSDAGLVSFRARAGSNLQVMYRTALAVSHTMDIDQLLHRIVQLIFECVEADRGCIMLINPDSRKLEPKVRHTRRGARVDERIAISKTILDFVLEHGEGVLTSDAREDDRWNPAQSIVQMGVREAICAPLQGRYGVVGVIYIDTLTTPQQVIQQGTTNKFNDEHLKLLIAIACQAALAIEDTQYYSAMVQAERLAAVGQTIATLSHHIKNILQGIRGGSFLIKEGLAQHDENMVGKGWQFVEKNQERISNLVMDMLTFSKEREPELTPSDLNQVVGDVVELMLGRAAERNVELKLEPSARIPTLTFDPEGVHRAVLNVVTNAIDASEPSAEESNPRLGRVTVRTEYQAEPAVARIHVEDNGPGIPADEIEQIFSLFVSGKGNRGTGLGLPVSEKIMKEHGGRIVVASELGRGTRFTLELPAVMSEAGRQTGPVPTR